MVVSLPTGDSLIADRVYMGCRVIIKGHEFRANLVLLDIQDFNVILGMDWLSRHHATMDCFRKEVKFCKPGELEITFLWGKEYIVLEYDVCNDCWEDAPKFIYGVSSLCS